jgi:hypothetical protein
MPVCTASLILWYGFMVDFGIANYHKYTRLQSPWMCWIKSLLLGLVIVLRSNDIVIALNGQSLMSLLSFHEIDFEGACDHMDGGKTDGRRNNINLTYGYSKQGFQLEPNEDGGHQ